MLAPYKPPLPRLTQAQAPLTEQIEVINEQGQRQAIAIPAERALTVYVDKRELVTLMTLGAQPEHLVLGYLRNQRLVDSINEIESITVDWEVGAAAVQTRHGIANIAARTANKVVTTGCGQGTVFGELQQDIDSIDLPSATIPQSRIYAVAAQIRQQDSVYKTAGSVHGCALFIGDEMRMFVEDVGRHNAIDTIAGWMWLKAPESLAAPDKLFYTTGRLTSEMVIKAAQMGVPFVVSRSGMTQMGHALAQRLGICAIGRALNQRFLCYAGSERLVWDGAAQPLV